MSCDAPGLTPRTTNVASRTSSFTRPILGEWAAFMARASPPGTHLTQFKRGSVNRPIVIAKALGARKIDALLLRPQRDERVDPGGATSRQVACERCDEAEDAEHGEKRHRIAGGHAKQQAAEQSGQSPGRGQA